MVFVNDKKYACETCIKGHRSSTCNHTERPLFEIKKKGRPITQCEHCRELRKTKQVHVKCLCEGREDHDSVSHSIPAKKANRKGPPPSAAFPYGLQTISAPASDSEDTSHEFLNKAKAPQKIGDLPSCMCKKVGGPCSCCTPRHPPRAKRSVTPPMARAKVADFRAVMPALPRPSSDPGDAQELSQRLLPIDPEPHALIHGHGTRAMHGSALFSPYGHAHDAHLRAHDIRNHEVATGQDASNGYIYPVPPISYSQQRQTFAARSEPSLVWPNGETISDDVNTMPASYDAQGSEYQPDPFGAVHLGSVDVDAWLREMTECNSNLSPSEREAVSSQQPSANNLYNDHRADPHTLPVPQSLDVSHDFTQGEDPDYAQASSQFDLLPRFGNIDLDFNDAYIGGSEQDIGDTNGFRSVGGIFDSQVFNLATSEAPPSVQEVQERAAELLGAVSAMSSQPPVLTVHGANDGDYQYASSVSPATEPKPQSQAQEYVFDYYLEPDQTIRPDQALPPLTRSSSVGSHSSGRSRSSAGMSHWTRNGSNDCIASEQWSVAGAPGTDNSWGLTTLSDNVRGWPASRVHSFAIERGRTLAKGAAATDSHSTMLN